MSRIPQFKNINHSLSPQMGIHASAQPRINYLPVLSDCLTGTGSQVWSITPAANHHADSRHRNGAIASCFSVTSSPALAYFSVKSKHAFALQTYHPEKKTFFEFLFADLPGHICRLFSYRRHANVKIMLISDGAWKVSSCKQTLDN